MRIEAVARPETPARSRGRLVSRLTDRIEISRRIIVEASRLELEVTDARVRIRRRTRNRIVGDSLLGWRKPIALADIESIRRRKREPVLTGFLIAGGTLAALLLFCAANDCTGFDLRAP